MQGHEIADRAREWVGTPFAWQQAAKGRGCDCKGLIAGIARELGRPEGQSVEALLIGDHRGRVPVSDLKHGLARLFDKAEIAREGDILLMRVGGKAQHLAIYVGNGRMVHCYQKGPGRVIEVPMGDVWWRAVDSVWRWR